MQHDRFDLISKRRKIMLKSGNSISLTFDHFLPHWCFRFLFWIKHLCTQRLIFQYLSAFQYQLVMFLLLCLGSTYYDKKFLTVLNFANCTVKPSSSSRKLGLMFTLKKIVNINNNTILPWSFHLKRFLHIVYGSLCLFIRRKIILKSL